VPANYEALLYAIKLKKQGIIENLIAGPNLAVFPSEITALPDNGLIDMYLQPSEWVIHLWRKIDPLFPIPLQAWYAGVDTTFWVPPLGKKNENTILIYKKHVPDDFFLSVTHILEQRGYSLEVIVYGSYTQKQYLEALQRNALLIHLTESESQGISLAEAWSTDTPTLVWNPQKLVYGNSIYTESSSAPYLTEQTGHFFKTPNDLAALIESYTPSTYSPRSWCTEHMSDKICADKLLGIIDTICGKK
jgi:hypothetical protein